MNTKIRVLVADDTEIARYGLRTILESEGDIEVVGEISQATAAVERAKGTNADILIMDLKWFGDETAGIAAIANLKRAAPLIRIMAITAYEDLIQRARNAGADVALAKTFTAEVLRNTVRDLFRGNTLPCLEVRPSSDNELSEREKGVLALMSRGLTDKQIAVELNIAESTAKNHVANILNKLNASNRAQAVTVGLKKRILD